MGYLSKAARFSAARPANRQAIIRGTMLILTRRPGESLYLGDTIKLKVLSIQGKQIKLAPMAFLFWQMNFALVHVKCQDNRISNTADLPPMILARVEQKSIFSASRLRSRIGDS